MSRAAYPCERIAAHARIETVECDAMTPVQSSSNPQRLDEPEIERRLQSLPEWSHAGDQLQRTFVFANFLEAMRFVNAISTRAEAVQHHPDILVRWNRVTLSLSTHDAGGISAKDFAFASDVDQSLGT